MMRFGLSDLDELPSLKEFEALAQAALGSDEGIAEAEPEESAAIGEEVVDGEVVNVEVVAEMESGAAVTDDLSDAAASEAQTVPGAAPEDPDKSRAAAASAGSSNQSTDTES